MDTFNLKRIIQELITEIDPITYSTDTVSKAAAKNKLKQTPGFNRMKPQDKTALFTGIDQDKDGGVLNLEEEEIDEMAAPVKYEIDDISKIDNLKLGTKALDRVKKLVSYVDSYGPVEKSAMAAKAFETPVRQQQINDLVSILTGVGILKISSGFEDKAKQFAQSYSWSRSEKEKPEEIPAPGKTSTKVSAKDIAASIASFPKGDGEEEPEMGNIKKSAGMTISPATQAAADFLYDASNDRLLQKIIGKFGATKIKVKEIKEAANDLSSGDFKSSEASRKQTAVSEIEGLIQEMADRINATGDVEVKKEILRLLNVRLSSIGYNMLYKRISRLVDLEGEEITERFKTLAGIANK
jgi:hypothetical protein